MGQESATARHRPGAEVHPGRIQDLAQGVYPSFAMLAGMQLDVFTPLQDGPRSAGDLAAELGVAGEKLELLLYALVAAGLLQMADDGFENGPEAARFLVRGRPEYVGGSHEALSQMWSAAMLAGESIRSGVPQAKIDFATMNEAELERFFRAFSAEARMAGRELADRFDFSSRRALIDVGGGSGGLAVALTEAWPRLEATVVDLPSVTPITERIVGEAGASERVRVLAADVVAAPPPGRYDVAVLRALVQVLDREQAARAIRHVGSALDPGGEILIIGRITEDTRVAPLPAVMSNLVFLSVFDSGGAYTRSEYRDWVERAGFEDIRVEIHPDGRGLVHAIKAAEQRS